VLPAPARLRRTADFATAVRRGRRGRSRLLLVHLAVTSSAAPSGEPAPARAGFVVSKAVGGAVVRNRVLRRLRHLTASRLPLLPAGSLLVVRALPEAATASSAQLAVALDRALRAALAGPARRVPAPAGPGSA
jgi:ribonuclease P protein component